VPSLLDPPDYSYPVEVADISVPAYIWLRNNQVAYSETLRMMPDGVRTVVWFRDEPDAVWFQLKWGNR
jgi:hypothetical protein